MKTKVDFEQELKQYGFPKQTTERIVALLEADTYEVHASARKDLVKNGDKILPVMYKLMKSEHEQIRKESAKIVELIAHESSIPYVVKMLDDRESEIRWIAAEALIRIGRPSIRAVLQELTDNASSYYLRQSAHHVLAKLLKKTDSSELKQLVHVLNKGMEIPERIPIDATNALKKGGF